MEWEDDGQRMLPHKGNEGQVCLSAVVPPPALLNAED